MKYFIVVAASILCNLQMTQASTAVRGARSLGVPAGAVPSKCANNEESWCCDPVNPSATSYTFHESKGCASDWDYTNCNKIILAVPGYMGGDPQGCWCADGYFLDCDTGRCVQTEPETSGLTPGLCNLVDDIEDAAAAFLGFGIGVLIAFIIVVVLIVSLIVWCCCCRTPKTVVVHAPAPTDK